ncbi:MAG: hypothetical protein ABIS27_12460 [Longimicrobiales bacterium]
MALAAFAPLLLAACAGSRVDHVRAFPTPGSTEHISVLDLYPGVTATIVAPANLDTAQCIDLILYALPNGNSTAETMGRKLVDGISWRYDIQHIGAQTRALRTRGVAQAVIVYLEADTKSWPEWRRKIGYDKANARIVELVDQVRTAVGDPAHLVVTLTGHSGGGSFAWGFIDGQAALPDWLERIAFLDSNYSFEPRHGDKIVSWLQRSRRNELVILAYDDREIMLDDKKVVSDSGGTWRATHRMMDYLVSSYKLEPSRIGDFLRFSAEQIEILLHPNPENRILHTEMIGEMNAYLHAMLVGRKAYSGTSGVLKAERAYEPWINADVILPAAAPMPIPSRRADAQTGSAFIAAIAGLSREEREAAIRRELLAGNIPSFLRVLKTVHASSIGADGVTRNVAYDVMPDYLAIGSDADFVRMPMNPYTAQAFCDAYGFVLPTSRMVNDIWSAAARHLDPRPLTDERESPLTFLQHHHIIEAQLGNADRSALIAGHKKDVVVSNKLLERPNRVAIFGWHYTTGGPIQPLYAGHVDWYVDYSHGTRPVRRSMRVDGVVRPFEKIIADPQLMHLLSDEGIITAVRYDGGPK